MTKDLALVARDIDEGDMRSARSRLAQNVRLLLAREGWNQIDLARRAGLSQGMISQLLAGEKGVRLSTLDKVAQALQVDVGELFAPASPIGSAHAWDLYSAARSALSSASRPLPPDVNAAGEGRRKILIDPEELREIGFAIGYAIFEAAQSQGARLTPVKRRRTSKSSDTDPRHPATK